jgi:hypothetical protein
MKFGDANVVLQNQAGEPRSDAERIADARARHMAGVKERNAPEARYGFGFDPSYYQDFAGAETSCFDAAHLEYVAGLLQVETPAWPRPTGRFTRRYDPRTAQWEFGGELISAPPVTIQQLRDAIDSRIAELGLSKVKIWEGLGECGSKDHKPFHLLSFEEKMQLFREA